jgi:SPP1 gp7 family putative phage head morphogenesis protein
MDLVTNMGEDMKNDLRSILSDNLARGGGTRDASKAMAEHVEGMSKGRAATIARTETTRARSLGNQYKAKEKGFQSYTVDSTAEVCDICSEFYGNMVFDVDDIESLPPSQHPNCLCEPFYRPGTPEEVAAELGYEVYSSSSSDTGIEQDVQEVLDVLTLLPEETLTGVLEQVAPDVASASELTTTDMTESMISYIDDPIAFTQQDPKNANIVSSLLQQMINNKGNSLGGG